MPGVELSRMSAGDRRQARLVASMLKDGEIPWGKASVPAHLRHPRAPEDTRLLGSLIVRSGKGTSGVSSYASGTHERPSAVEAAGGMAMTVDTSDPSSLRRYAVKVSDAAENHAYVGRFFPVTVTRLSKFVDGQGRRKRYLSDVAVPRLTPKLAHVVVDRLEDWPEVLRALSQLLCQRQGVGHITLQPEPPSHRIRTPKDPYTAGHQGQCTAAEA